MDNTFSNDTFIKAYERKCHEWGIELSAVDTRIRCMPHTAHLAALKVVFSLCKLPSADQFIVQLLEAIGVISKTDRKKASGRSDKSYQETVSTPLSRDNDDDTTLNEDEEKECNSGDEQAVPELKAIQKIQSEPFWSFYCIHWAFRTLATSDYSHHTCKSPAVGAVDLGSPNLTKFPGPAAWRSPTDAYTQC